MVFVGIDYSMTSPAIAIAQDDSFQICFLTDTKKYDGYWQSANFRFCGIKHKDWTHPIERYTNIGYWALSLIPPGVKNAYIEDYAMGAKGKVFGIAENTGILKYILWNNNIKYKTIPPTVVKKYAFGKGNADKEKMYEAWIKAGNPDLKSILNIDKCVSPLSDIVDSYWLCRMAIDNA